MGNGHEPVRRGLETSAYGGEIRKGIRHIRVRPLSAGNHTGGKWRDSEDVMQSSESMGLPPNSLDTESSIKQGCKYFASLLSSAENQGIEDINVVVQSYNYGGGYIDYVAKNGKKHSFTLAENFARDKSGGTKVTYTNPIAVAHNGGWRYGTGICSMWSLSASTSLSVKYRASWHRR